MMSGEHFSDEAEPGQSRAKLYYWWRTATKFDECVKLKMDLPNISMISPTCKVLREMERLASIASEGLHELRQKLSAYRSGDMWLPIGGKEKKDMDIPPVNTILLVGFHNAGKSSLVNLMYTILGRSGLVPFAQTCQIYSENSTNYASFLMEEHNVLRSTRSGFCVYDTRGFDYDCVDETLTQLSEWMTDGVRHNQLCLRQRDHLTNRAELEIHSSRSCAMYANRRVNCVMVVVNVEEIREAVKVGDKKPLEALRQLFALAASKKSNENPILILTHGDKLSTEDRIYIRLKICESIGTSESNGTYDIVCVTEYGFLPDEVDPVTAYALTEAVYRALIISDRGHLPKRKLQDSVSLVLSWFMCSIAKFFAFFAHFFSRLGRKKLKW
ncbi:hypothetical protein ACH5RR_010837 [Cinchona calisaya]|uniref:G domain-containing protein n=1 Tax=Cinchona calisaya TaxID=153742 RepID=A0ABD3AK26_9GENT